ncbi:MAG: recombinase family protein [Deltaproteobacteria bacterium]|nr:recombinase family protein [Deltaproteobacteria bacterium]
MRVAHYARVSTDHNQDTELQLHDLRAFAAAKGWAATEYVDEGYSGSKSRRPALDKLMDDCRKGKVSRLIVWRLDRFSRSLKHLITTIEELEALGITFISYKENIDLGTPGGRLMVQMLGAFSEFERNIIRERVKAGLKNAQRKGRVLGKKPLPLDFDKIHSLRSQGQTIKQIAVQCGCSTTPIMRALKG